MNYYNKSDLKIEIEQLLDEGKDISMVEEEFNALLKFDNNINFQLKEELLKKIRNLPTINGYKYNEPSDFENICKSRPREVPIYKIDLSDEKLFDKVYGAWLGRCSGCLLGKPVEGWKVSKIHGYLKDLNRYPLNDFFKFGVDEKIKQKYSLDITKPFVDLIDHMPEDDDLNYTVAGLCIIKKHGKNFSPIDVANFWLENIPASRLFTAERVAYRNFLLSIKPPESASFCNPYREWIGAQIRADFYGYVSLGNPKQAAEFAFRDASISHIKNGIYGAMWVAAMLSIAVVEDDIKKILQLSLSVIPSQSRLAESISNVISCYQAGMSYEEVVNMIHKRWNEDNPHHFTHVISNAQIVAVGLLWGENDFEKSICRAVQAGFDTDCNGATVGSIIGMILGAKNLPQKWISPLNGMFNTGILGYENVKIEEIAKESFELYKKIN